MTKLTTVKDMLKAKRDAIKQKPILNGSKSGKTTEASSSESSSDSSENEEDADDGNQTDRSKSAKPDDEINGTTPKVPSVEAKLPDNLTSDLLELIEKIKEASKLPHIKSSNFFTPENSEIIFK